MRLLNEMVNFFLNYKYIIVIRFLVYSCKILEIARFVFPGDDFIYPKVVNFLFPAI